MKTFWKQKSLVLLLILGCVGIAQAQTRADWTGTLEAGTYELTSSGGGFQVKKSGTILGTYSSIGNLRVTSGNVTIQLKNSNIITFNGYIYVTGGHLTIQKMQKVGGSTLKRLSSYTGRFLYVENTTGTNPDNCRLTLKGYANGSEESYIVINGGDDGYHIVGPDAEGNYEAVREDGSSQAVNSEWPLLTVVGGHVEAERVEFTRNWNGASQNGGAILVTTSSASKSQCVVNFNKVLIQNCFVDKSGAAIYTHCDLVNNKVSSISIKNSTIRNCFANASVKASGGVIRTVGISFCTLSIEDCTFYNNYTNKAGGITWNAGRVDAIKVKNSEFYNNWTRSSGGALNFGSLAEITNCKIHDNTAKDSGGGVAYGTWGSDGPVSNFHPKDGDLVLDANTEIYNNTAGNHGGGLYVDIHPIITGQDDPATQDTVYTNINGQTYSVKLNVEGATIHNNTAGIDGGGVYMKRNTDIYNTDINLKYGNIYENEADRNGGALAVTGGAPVNVGSTSGTLTMIDNTAKNGGGIYLQGGNITLANCNVGLLNHPNTAEGGNGGGIYVTGGNFTMNSGSFAYNNAEKIGSNTGNGGGFCVSGGTVTLKGGTIEHNTADANGGGFYVDPGAGFTTTINNTNSVPLIDNNTAMAGGAVYANSGNVHITGATITNNTSTDSHGGAFVVANGSLTVDGASLIDTNHAPNGNGGGAFVSGGDVMFSAGTIFTNNNAKDGGAICVKGGELTLDNSDISYNVADFRGGAIFVSDTTIGGTHRIGEVTLQNGAMVKNNHSGTQGGGVYVGGGSFTMTGGTIGGTTEHGNYTTSSGSYGGGLYMGGGTATISNSAISGNYTYSRTSLDGCGGAIYMNGGSCTLSNGANIGGTSTSYANTSKYGGAIYSANGTITVKGGKIGYNNAEKGGGIYANGSKAKVYVQKNSSKADVLSYIEHNTAQYGGGIYGEKGRVEFSDGYIQYNTASQQGGGIYVDANDTLYLKGSANLVLNGVPTGHKGGGVYLVGSLIVGEQTTPLGTIMARSNYAYTTTQPDTLLTSGGDVAEDIRNNVYLPNPVVHTYTENTHAGVIEVVEDGISTASHVGFSVPHGNVPVIYCTRSSGSWAYLHQFSTGQLLQYNLFDDSGRYKSVQYSNDPAFDPDHVYLYGFWSDEVTGGDGDYCVVDKTIFTNHQNDTIPITTPCELAYFISWVNGREDPTHLDPHPGANAKLMDDIDMSEFGWVPIGTEANPYSGVFNGNGHTVSGIRSLLNDYHTDYGFFGKLASGAKVKDLFLIGSSFHIEKKGGYSGTMYIGGVAGRTSGNATIQNCEASGILFVEPENTNSVIGGLVGKTNSGDKIHSSIGIADISGFLMGGLVGQNSGELLNSFANAQFSSLTGNTQYYGGLVAENSGTVENCYVRLRGTVPAASTKFGLLAGLNDTGAEVKYCYSSADGNYFKSDSGTALGYGWFADTQVPYLYARRDNQVTLAQSTNPYKPTQANPNPDLAVYGVDMQMVRFLNAWVAQKNGSTSTYAYWKRPTTKAINNDLPILKMPHSNINAVYCAGNTDGTEDEIYLNYGEINDILATQRQAGEAIWLYKNKDNMAGNNGSDAKLYIDEGVTVRQVADLYAYVGVTLDNSANAGGAHPTFPNSQGQYITDYTDWHMFSTPLANAPLGVNYKGDTNPYSSGDFSQPGHPDGMPYYQFYDNEEAASGDEDWERRGYFPSHVYNSTYTDDNTGETTGGNYYREWDFYTYFEPEYHWVNFKRNSNAHYHQNAPDVPIVYTHYDSETGNIVTGNETYLTQGRGYLVATREETFLQCQGLLNGTSGQVSIPVTYSGYYSPGYNFLGNPYLAYLDFDEFARVNKVLWGGGTDTDFTASYAVIDEDEGGYIYRAIRCSANPNTAPQYIAPHQGFMILAVEDIEDDAAAVFYPNMRDLNGDGGHFRGEEQPAYPLVNLIATDDNGNRDIATVELGRPDRGGAPLMRELRQCKGHVWCHYEGKDWAIAFTQPGLTEAAIRFETFEDGEYTMRWNTQNGDFSYLHLIDNMTGADIDCLATDEYRFTSSTMDYKSRFRLVFGYTGIEEPEGDDPAQGSFAYQSGDELVVTGEGTVELFDVTGRRMSAERIEGVQGTMSVSGLTPGVYLLRLNTATGTRVQKIVINQ